MRRGIRANAKSVSLREIAIRQIGKTSMNMPSRLAAVLVAFSALSGFNTAARAETTIKIGVLNDLSGPYSDLSGKGSVIAAQMAAEDFAKEAGAGAPKIEILSGDHQNKADKIGRAHV